MKKGARYFQLCMPALEPIQVYIVKKLDDTARGVGGVGGDGGGGSRGGAEVGEDGGSD